MIKINYEDFKKKYLIKGFTNNAGNPVHTRLYKKLFYRFNKNLKEEFGPQLDLFYCSEPDCHYHTTFIHNGKPIVMELEHINRDTSDARPENLKSLCCLCHTQTLGYKNRKVSITEYHQKLQNLQN